MNQLIKGFSHFLSVLFHPLFIIIYVLWLFLMINPYLFPYRNGVQFVALFMRVFFISVMIPIISILTMYGTGLIQSIKMEEKTERIGPLIVTSIAYLWLYLNIRTHSAIPTVFSSFVLGAVISLFIAFFINNFSKISLHALGLGGLLLSVFHLSLSNGRAYAVLELFGDMSLSIHNLLLLVVIIIVIGAVLSSRLHLKAHQLQDVTGGLMVGIIGQIISLKLF